MLLLSFVIQREIIRWSWEMTWNGEQVYTSREKLQLALVNSTWFRECQRAYNSYLTTRTFNSMVHDVTEFKSHMLRKHCLLKSINHLIIYPSDDKPARGISKLMEKQPLIEKLYKQTSKVKRKIEKEKNKVGGERRGKMEEKPEFLTMLLASVDTIEVPKGFSSYHSITVEKILDNVLEYKNWLMVHGRPCTTIRAVRATNKSLIGVVGMKQYDRMDEYYNPRALQISFTQTRPPLSLSRFINLTSLRISCDDEEFHDLSPLLMDLINKPAITRLYLEGMQVINNVDHLLNGFVSLTSLQIYPKSSSSLPPPDIFYIQFANYLESNETLTEVGIRMPQIIAIEEMIRSIQQSKLSVSRWKVNRDSRSQWSSVWIHNKVERLKLNFVPTNLLRLSQVVDLSLHCVTINQSIIEFVSISPSLCRLTLTTRSHRSSYIDHHLYLAFLGNPSLKVIRQQKPYYNHNTDLCYPHYHIPPTPYSIDTTLLSLPQSSKYIILLKNFN